MKLLDYPFITFVLAFLLMWATAYFSARIFAGAPRLEDEEKSEFDLIVGATLTLLGLLIGFSFSMAVGRYDQRKNYEEEEANAIGTEYVRLDLLPVEDARKLQPLMRQYLELRIQFYERKTPAEHRRIDAETAQLQSQMWSAVGTAAKAQPTAVSALAVSGMNDVLNRQGYTQAAWWNRIPAAAWYLMFLIAASSNLMIGYAARHLRSKRFLFIIPAVLAMSFLLLADLDSPRGGVINIKPQNLLSLAESLK
jgi:hypothetical protein